MTFTSIVTAILLTLPLSVLATAPASPSTTEMPIDIEISAPDTLE